MATAPELTVDTDEVRVLIVKAKQINAKEGNVVPDPGSNGADDGMDSVLQIDPENDATRQEISSYIQGMNVDEQADLVALTLIGRGDYSLVEWDDARRQIDNIDAPIERYLLDQPLVASYLSEGLDMVGEDGITSGTENARESLPPGGDGKEAADTFEKTAGGDGR